ncbi:MAG: TldD/PmbA family protein [Clostridiales bacterium]|nr:TldD/PmbA family protein [Clostridiales bacterium]
MRAKPCVAAQELALKSTQYVDADAAEAVVVSKDSALTRFAGNRIHQNVAEFDTKVSIRAIVGSRTGSASTNLLDERSLRECAASAVAAARVSPPDPDFTNLPGPGESGAADVREPGLMLDPDERADAILSIVEQSRARGLEAADGIETSIDTVAVANSLGVMACATVATLRATVLSSGPAAGTGWASYYGADIEGFDAVAIGDEAATLALRGANPIDLEPGAYTVVLAPEAVADIVDFLGYAGFSARSYSEGRSFMSGRLGETIVSRAITIEDDAHAPGSCGIPFDFEGQPRHRVTLIGDGVAMTPVTDSYWAARMGSHNTGHALPAPNSLGPLPLDMRMRPGDVSLDALIARVERGVYVTRFHYVNIEDPVPVTLTGMTRDGTFLIENGALTAPLKNLRFTQSAIEALGQVKGVASGLHRYKIMLGCACVPGLLIDGWTFTGQTG